MKPRPLGDALQEGVQASSAVAKPGSAPVAPHSAVGGGGKGGGGGYSKDELLVLRYTFIELDLYYIPCFLLKASIDM